ncbi:YkvA family protein [Planococcus dechangensis]|uniref:YkvA family protein n=2 Tax=Planococcus dechangensis TaxID=1176255 RepID=A0ABV9M9U6_9BACL
MSEHTGNMEMPSEQQQRDTYQKLRLQAQQYMESKSSTLDSAGQFALLAPDLFHLLTRLMLDSRIDKKSKALVGGGLLYFVAPIDVLPEILVGPGGYLDDVIVAVFIINTILNKLPQEVVTEHWAGDEDLLNTLRKLAGSGNKLASKLPAGRLIRTFTK